MRDPCEYNRAVAACQFDPFDFAFAQRDAMINEYAWGIPCPEAVDALVEVAPIIEVGAGGGYWASLLRAAGADVIAYEPHIGVAYGRAARHGEACRVWTDLRAGDHAVASRYPDRTLLMIWPTMDRWAGSAMRLYARAGGHRVAYVGEPAGGCTADDQFFHGLEALDFAVTREVDIPQWPGLHDYLAIFERA